MNKTVIYARFSSDRQTEVSIDAQVRACTEYAVNHGLQISKIYKDEAISGTTAARAGYQELLEDAMMDKFDTVLIHKYDRISRDMSEQAILDRKFRALNIQLIAVAQDFGNEKEGRLTKGITWALAEYYSANLAEEVRKGLRESALNALHCGGVPPFGYDVVDKKLVINEIEAHYVRQMFEYCVSLTSYRPLIEEMSSLGITGKRGKPIKHSQIGEILRNEKYTGTFVYSAVEEKDRMLRRSKPNAIRVENAFPAIVDRETFQRVQEIISSRKTGYRTTYPMSGLVYCECGGKMYRHCSTKKKNGNEYKHNYYRCQSCGKIIKAELIEESVSLYMEEVFSDDTMQKVEEYLQSADKKRRGEIDSFNRLKAEQLSKAEAELTELMNALASGLFRNNYEAVDRMITEKQNKIDTIKAMACPVPTDQRLKTWLEKLKANDKTPKAFIDRIEVGNDRILVISSFESEIMKKSAPSEEDAVLKFVVAEEGFGEIQRLFNRTYCAAR